MDIRVLVRYDVTGRSLNSGADENSPFLLADGILLSFIRRAVCVLAVFHSPVNFDNVCCWRHGIYMHLQIRNLLPRARMFTWSLLTRFWLRRSNSSQDWKFLAEVNVDKPVRRLFEQVHFTCVWFTFRQQQFLFSQSTSCNYGLGMTSPSSM